MKKWIAWLLTLTLLFGVLPASLGEDMVAAEAVDAEPFDEPMADAAVPDDPDDDLTMDATVVEAEGVEAPLDDPADEMEEVARGGYAYIPPDVFMDGTTGETKQYFVNSDFPLTLELSFTANGYVSFDVFRVRNGTLTAKLLSHTMSSGGTITRAFTMPRHGGLMLRVYAHTGGAYLTAYRFRFRPIRSAVVWSDHDAPLNGTPKTPFKVTGEVRMGSAYAYAFELLKWGAGGFAPVPGTKVFTSAPIHKFYPNAPGRYKARMWYFFAAPTVTDPEDQTWQFVDGEDVYVVNQPAGRILWMDSSEAYYECFPGGTMWFHLAFDAVPQISLLRIYNQAGEVVHEAVTQPGTYDILDVSYLARFEWTPTREGKYIAYGLSYDGQNWHSLAYHRWFEVKQPTSLHLMDFAVTDRSVQVGEIIGFTITTQGLHQGSCLLLEKDGVEKARFYGIGKNLEQYIYAPTEPGLYEYRYFMFIHGAWMEETIVAGEFSVAKAVVTAPKIYLIRDRVTGYGCVGLIAGFDTSSPLEVPSFAGFYLKDYDSHYLIRSKVTTNDSCRFLRLPPGTYYCEVHYLSNGEWRSVITPPQTITQQDWSEFGPLAY